MPIERDRPAVIPTDLEWVVNEFFGYYEREVFPLTGVCQKCWGAELRLKISEKWKKKLGTMRETAFDAGWAHRPVYRWFTGDPEVHAQCPRCGEYIRDDLRCSKCNIQFEEPPKKKGGK